jgi:hypothetical protein
MKKPKLSDKERRRIERELGYKVEEKSIIIASIITVLAAAVVLICIILALKESIAWMK